MARFTDQLQTKRKATFVAGETILKGDILQLTNASTVKPANTGAASIVPVTTIGFLSPRIGALSSVNVDGAAVLTNGNIVTCYRNSATTALYFSITTPLGAAVSSDVVVESGLTELYIANVTALLNGGFAVAYYGSTGIRSAVFSSAGTVVTAPFLIEAGAASAGGFLKMCTLTSGEYVVLFSSTTVSMKFGRFSATGTLQGSLTVVYAGTGVGSPQGYGGIAALASGGFATVTRNSASNIGVIRYTSTGTVSSSATVTTVVNAEYVDCAGTSDGGVLTVFNYSTSLYVAKFNSSTVLTVAPRIIATTDVRAIIFSGAISHLTLKGNAAGTAFSLTASHGAVACVVVHLDARGSLTSQYESYGLFPTRIVHCRNDENIYILGRNATGGAGYESNALYMQKIKRETTTKTTTNPLVTTTSPTPSRVTPLITADNDHMFDSTILPNGDIVCIAASSTAIGLTLVGLDGSPKYTRMIEGFGGVTFGGVGIATLANGNVVVIYTNNSAVSGLSVHAAIYSPTLEVVTPTFQCWTVATAATVCAAVGLVGGGFALAWGYASSTVACAVYDSNATKLGADFTFGGSANVAGRSIHMTPMSNGDFLVFHQDAAVGARVTRVSALGYILINSLLIHTTANPTYFHSVAELPNDGFMVVSSWGSTSLLIKTYDAAAARFAEATLTVPASTASKVVKMPDSNCALLYYPTGSTQCTIVLLDVHCNILQTVAQVTHSSHTSLNMLASADGDLAIVSASSTAINVSAVFAKQSIVGVADADATVGQSVKVITEGEAELRESRKSTRFSMTGIGGAKWSILNKSATLTKQVNSLG